jgi:hypothetical protein
LNPERDRVAHLASSGRWQVTYADVQAVVLVERTPATAAYRARHPFTPAPEPPGMVTAPAGRRARQRMCYARLVGALGFVAEARGLLARSVPDAAAEPTLLARIAELDQGLRTGTRTQ